MDSGITRDSGNLFWPNAGTYNFGRGQIFLATATEYPGLLIALNNDPERKSGELTEEDQPKGVDFKGPHNLCFRFYNRLGLRALMDHLREIDDTWERKGWPE